MSVASQDILVIGGGFSGMSAAIQLAKAGHRVDLVEIDAGWRSYGAGISIHGPSLRALGTIGVLEAFSEVGATSDGFDLFAGDGRLIVTMPTPRLAGQTAGGIGGIMRPALAKILSHATRAAGVSVRLGCTFNTIVLQPDRVDVTFTDGTQRSYQLAIGADGLFSKVRETLVPDAPQPRYTGQGVWRAVVPRTVERGAMFMGRSTKVGVNPVSRDEMYLFVTEARPLNERLADDRLVPMLKTLLADFTAPVVSQVRERLATDCQVVYRPLEGMLMPLPWHRGRVLMIGDAVHATTPHLGQGAGMAIEDSLVLAEELARHADVESAFQAYRARRFERCAYIVRTSLAICMGQLGKGPPVDNAKATAEMFAVTAQPI